MLSSLSYFGFPLIIFRHTLNPLNKLFPKTLQPKLLDHLLPPLIILLVPSQNLLHLLGPFLGPSINQEPTGAIIAYRLLGPTTVVRDDGDIAVHGLAWHNPEMLISGSVQHAGCMTEEGFSQLV